MKLLDYKIIFRQHSEIRFTFSETWSNTKIPNVFLQCAHCHVFAFIRSFSAHSCIARFWVFFPRPAGQFPFQHVWPYRVKCRSNFCTAHGSLCFFHNSSLQNFLQGSSRCVETGAWRSDLPMTTDA